jgi:hypothetical protein
MITNKATFEWFSTLMLYDFINIMSEFELISV